jgi:hypothetical protein
VAVIITQLQKEIIMQAFQLDGIIQTKNNALYNTGMFTPQGLKIREARFSSRHQYITQMNTGLPF